MHCLFINLFHLWQLHPNINWVMAFGVALNGTLVHCFDGTNRSYEPTVQQYICTITERETENDHRSACSTWRKLHFQKVLQNCLSTTKIHFDVSRCSFSQEFCHLILCVCMSAFLWAHFHIIITPKWTWHREVRNYRHIKYDSRQRNKSRSGNVHCICT